MYPIAAVYAVLLSRKFLQVSEFGFKLFFAFYRAETCLQTLSAVSAATFAVSDFIIVFNLFYYPLVYSQAGLPDGIFSNQKILEGLAMEDVGIHIVWPFGLFYGHLVYFTSIWSILCPFGLFYGHMVHYVSIWYILWLFSTYIFARFGMLYQENLLILQPGKPEPILSKLKYVIMILYIWL
jgi:hypothetical protein